MSNNVIQFPNSIELPRTAKESRKRLMEIQKEYLDEVAETAFDNMINEISLHGYYIKDAEIHQKDFINAREAIRALLYRYVPGLKHELHEAIDHLIQIK